MNVSTTTSTSEWLYWIKISDAYGNPTAMKNGYVREHRYITERVLARNPEKNRKYPGDPENKDSHGDQDLYKGKPFPASKAFADIIPNY